MKEKNSLTTEYPKEDPEFVTTEKLAWSFGITYLSRDGILKLQKLVRSVREEEAKRLSAANAPVAILTDIVFDGTEECQVLLELTQDSLKTHRVIMLPHLLLLDEMCWDARGNLREAVVRNGNWVLKSVEDFWQLRHESGRTFKIPKSVSEIYVSVPNSMPYDYSIWDVSLQVYSEVIAWAQKTMAQKSPSYMKGT